VVAGMLHGKAVAVKTPRTRQDQMRVKELAVELRVLRRVRHANIVLLHGALVDPRRKELALVYELVGGVTLDKFVSQRGEPPEAMTRFCLAHDICCALRFLHVQSPPIIHGDVKDGNVMVEPIVGRSSARAKLIDFGLARFEGGETARRIAGTKAWKAPEAFLVGGEGRATTSADVFSFGWLIYFVMAGLQPHCNRHGEALQEAIVTMLQQQQVEPLFMPSDSAFREDARALSEACLSFQKEARPDMASVQASLVGWLSMDLACEFGFDMAVSKLPRVPWRKRGNLLSPSEGAEQAPSGGFAEQAPLPEVQVDIEAVGALPIASVHPRAIRGLEHCAAFESFCEWLEDPEPLRVLTCSVAADICHGIVVPPLISDWGRFALRPPLSLAPPSLGSDDDAEVGGIGGGSGGGEGASEWLELTGGDRRLTAAIKIFFPDASGHASLRLGAWRLEADGDQDDELSSFDAL